MAWMTRNQGTAAQAAITAPSKKLLLPEPLRPTAQGGRAALGCGNARGTTQNGRRRSRPAPLRAWGAALNDDVDELCTARMRRSKHATTNAARTTRTHRVRDAPMMFSPGPSSMAVDLYDLKPVSVMRLMYITPT